MKTNRKLLSILMTLAMVVSMIPAFGVTASAAEMCTVTFHNNGHGVLKVQSVQIEKGKSMNGSGTLSYQKTWMGKADGLQHSGWSTNPNAIAGSKDEYNMNSEVQGDMDLYAIWSHYIDHVELSLPESSKPVAGASIPAEPKVDLIFPGNPSTSETYYEIDYSDKDWIKDTVWLNDEGTPVTSGTFKDHEKYTLRVKVYSWVTYKAGPLPFTLNDYGYSDMTSATLDGKQAVKIEGNVDSEVILYFDFSVGEPVTKYQWEASGTTKTKGLAVQGETVTLTALDDGMNYGVYYSFDHWEVKEGGVTLTHPTKRTASFEMPAKEVYIQAVFVIEPSHVVNVGTLNVRELPDSNSKRIGGLTGGKEVTVVDTQGEWSMIIYGTDTAWVQSKYLTPINAYGINVTNGYANVSQAREGKTVTISYTGPNSILKNKMTEFDHWEVTSGNVTLADPNSKVTTFVMPAGNVIIEGVYKNIEEPKSNPFEDIYESDDYYNAVLWAYYASPQVTNGMDATHFGPNLTVTRAQAVTFLWRSQGCPEPSSMVNPFVDVPSTEYYYKPVLWAVENNITKGTTDTTFDPGDTLTTAHIVTFLYRTKNPGMDGWYGEAAAWAADSDGKPFGVDIAVNNDTDCPRCNVVQFLYKLSK